MDGELTGGSPGEGLETMAKANTAAIEVAIDTYGRAEAQCAQSALYHRTSKKDLKDGVISEERYQADRQYFDNCCAQVVERKKELYAILGIKWEN